MATRRSGEPRRGLCSYAKLAVARTRSVAFMNALHRSLEMMKTDMLKRKSKNCATGALELAMELMAIPGKSGNESQVAETIRKKLRAVGAPADALRQDAAHQRTPIDGQCGNLVLKLPGTYRAPRRLLMAHMDTVPICVGSQPERVGKSIRSANPRTGLGADDRAGVAVTLHTAMEIFRNRVPHPPLTFLWTVQEEIGLHGARNVRLSMLGNPKLAFNWDGGLPGKLTIGATGGYRMNIHVEGIASHAGNSPEEGVSAIVIASMAIAELQKTGWHGQVTKRGKSGTTNIGVIRGGEATNVVTDQVFLRAEARSHDPEFRRVIVKQIEKAFRTAASQIRNAKGKAGKIRIEGQLDYESFRLEKKHPTVLAAAKAVAKMGETAELRITNGGVDANWMSARGIPTVTLGCGQRNPHMITEALDVRDFEKACEIAWYLATPTE